MQHRATTEQISSMDIYSSRAGNSAHIVPRQEPVVYTTDHTAGPLTQAQIQRYERQGFLIIENVFDVAEVALLQAEQQRLRETAAVEAAPYTITEPGDNAVRSVFRVHEISALFNRLARDERLVGLAQYLLDDSVYVHQSRLNYKPGFRGKEFYWHSDFETWHVEDGMPRMRALSISISLTGNQASNGPLMLVPGSHKSYVACPGHTPTENYKTSLKKQEYGVPSDDCIQCLVDTGGIVNAECNSGSIIVFDSNILHGSNSNITPHARSNVFVVYNALSNYVVAPYSGQSPRPEYICTRQGIKPVVPAAPGPIRS